MPLPHVSVMTFGRSPDDIRTEPTVPDVVQLDGHPCSLEVNETRHKAVD